MGGTKEIAVLLMVLFSFCSPSSSSSSSSSSFSLSQTTFSSVRLQENDVKDKEMNEHINFAHSTGGRPVNGGQSAGKGENGNNGGTKSPYVPGGAAVIPLYAAGAAGSHHNNHHNEGVRNQSRIGFPTLVAAIFALFIMHICVVF